MKNAKRNWNKRFFCHVYVIGDISIGGGGGRTLGPSPPWLHLCNVYWRRDLFNYSKETLRINRSYSKASVHFFSPKLSVLRCNDFFLIVEYLTHGSLYSMSHQEASNQCAARGGSLALPHDLYLAKQSGYRYFIYFTIQFWLLVLIP